MQFFLAENHFILNGINKTKLHYMNFKKKQLMYLFRYSIIKKTKKHRISKGRNDGVND